MTMNGAFWKIMAAILIAGVVIVAVDVALVVSALAAPQNPQRIVRTGHYPVFVNGTGVNQTIAHTAYVNQTQYTPAPPPGTTHGLLFRPTP